MEIKKLQCSNCGAVGEIPLLPGQSIYRCKACTKLSKVQETSAAVEVKAEEPQEVKPTKKRKKKKNE